VWALHERELATWLLRTLRFGSRCFESVPQSVSQTSKTARLSIRISPEEVATMSDIAGMTSDGFDYTAMYVAAVLNSVVWAATFRLDGDYRGARHGRVFEVSELSITDLQQVIKDDIECAWVSKA